MATAMKTKPAPTVPALLKSLASCKDTDKAAYLRVKLRKLGHKGGLRKVK